ncbi:N-acetyllactosaminide beta-1,3-N-acetylglucosaminyltransferase 3-like [Leuresthes tenuis]|uniref:N-acetyllactosaminide beta-1,3-N-acetylglucosaminyltransferase 3-like n=1 Tax=Leuresthes tenuis TaxID=355514 RepID=UPI003B50C7BF
MARDLLKPIAQTLLLLGLLGTALVMLYVKKDSTEFIVIRSEDVDEYCCQVSSDITINTTQAFPMPKCQQNTSVTNITGFSSLSDSFKNFLYYQHCRHFPILLDLPDKCEGVNKSGEIFLLLVIKSSPGNYERREVLRKTWAKERSYNGVQIRRIFISGTSGDGFEKEQLNKMLKLEYYESSDILQWDFSDTFHNLTLKQTLFLKWMEENCPNVRFVLNGDDDVFVHTNNVIEYLQNLPDNDGKKHLFTGHLLQNEKPVRWTPSKYYIPTQIQESNQYPPYCGGGGFLMSGYTARVIYTMSQHTPLHPIDDAYMGMCLAKAGLAPSSHIGMKTLGINTISKPKDHLEPCYLRELLLVHRFLPPQIYIMWKQVQDPHLKCRS